MVYMSHTDTPYILYGVVYTIETFFSGTYTNILLKEHAINFIME